MNLQELYNNWKNFGLNSSFSKKNFKTEISKIPNTIGIYRIYTNCPQSILKTVNARLDLAHNNFEKKINETDKLPKDIITKQYNSEMYCIYNGMAENLRARATSHFKGTKGTGCLAIFETSIHLRFEWKFEYLELNKTASYIDSKIFRTYLERLDRNIIGWPILCSE